MNLTSTLPLSSLGKDITKTTITNRTFIAKMYVTLNYLILSIETLSKFFFVSKTRFNYKKRNHCFSQQYTNQRSEQTSEKARMKERKKEGRNEISLLLVSLLSWTLWSGLISSFRNRPTNFVWKAGKMWQIFSCLKRKHTYSLEAMLALSVLNCSL